MKDSGLEFLMSARSDWWVPLIIFFVFVTIFREKFCVPFM